MRNLFRKIFEKIFKRRPLVAVIKMNGVIGTGGFGRSRINYESIENIINKAFGERRAKAISLVINSPGGSPVQSSLIYKRVRYLADKKDIPVLVFVEPSLERALVPALSPTTLGLFKSCKNTLEEKS